MAFDIKLTVDNEVRYLTHFNTALFVPSRSDKMLISSSDPMYDSTGWIKSGPYVKEAKDIREHFSGKGNRLPDYCVFRTAEEYQAWTFNLLKGYDRHAQYISRPLAGVLDGLLNLQMRSSDSDDFFYHWFFSGEMYAGAIEFYRPQEDFEIPFRRIEFWDAFIASVGEQTTYRTPMTMDFVISPAIIRYNHGVVFRKSWFITDIDKKETKGTNSEETQVSEIELITPLDYCSYTKKKGMKLGNTYKFQVKSYTNGAPDDTDTIQWQFSHEAHQGGVVVHGNGKGDTFEIKVTDNLMEQVANMPITFSAFIKERNGGELDVRLNPLYYYEGVKEWGKLESELTLSDIVDVPGEREKFDYEKRRELRNLRFSASAHRLSYEELRDDPNNTDIGKVKMFHLNHLLAVSVIEEAYAGWLMGQEAVLSDNDNIEQKVIQNFLYGNGKPLIFNESSVLSQKLRTHSGFQLFFKNYLLKVKKLIENQLDEVLYNMDEGNIENPNQNYLIRIGKPNFSKILEIPTFDYYGFMGGVQAVRVEIKVTQTSTTQCILETKMHIRDWYGAGWDDIRDLSLKSSVSSLVAFFWLQHHFGKHPFETGVIYKSVDVLDLQLDFCGPPKPNNHGDH